MSKQWYYSRGREKVVGPCSSAEIRRLAGSGQLLPHDLVRGGRMERPVQARMIRGLFPSPTP